MKFYKVFEVNASGHLLGIDRPPVRAKNIEKARAVICAREDTPTDCRLCIKEYAAKPGADTGTELSFFNPEPEAQS